MSPRVDRECHGEGATHHHACKCREEYFTKMEAALQGLLKFTEELCEDIKVSKHYPSMDKARAALEGK